MIVFSQKRHKTGGKRAIPVVRLTATGSEDFERLLAVCGELLQGTAWWGFWPTRAKPWDWDVRRVPYVCVREKMLAVLVAEGAVELAEPYWQLCAHWCKREFWRELWVGHSDRERDGSAERYWTLRERSLLIALRKSGQWVRDPQWVSVETACEIEILIPGLKMIHQRIDNFDLGQQSPVNPGQSPDIDPNGSVNEPNGMDQSIPHPNLEAYYRLPVEDREAYLTAKPWLRSLLQTIH